MEYLHNDREQFLEAINLVVYRTGISPEAVEKDYYVTMLLKKIAEKIPFIVFKGGTSLSKCHRVINRFSEDIDLTIDTSISQGQKKNVKETLVEIVKDFGLDILNLDDTRSRRDYNQYIIGYQSVLPTENAIVQPRVLIETSYTAISFPTESLPVCNYIGDMMELEAPDFIEVYGLNPFNMKVQGLDRTLVDKVFAICDYYMQDKTQKHSRHIYDIYKIWPLLKKNEDLADLIEDVRIVRRAAPICPSAQDGVSISKLLQEITDKAVYKTDYQNITEGLLEESIAYNKAAEVLKEIIESGVFR